MNAKAHKGGRPKKEYEERDDGKNFERFDSVAGHVLSVTREDIETSSRKKASTTPVAGRAKRKG